MNCGEKTAHDGVDDIGQICPTVCQHLSERSASRDSDLCGKVELAHEFPKGATVLLRSTNCLVAH